MSSLSGRMNIARVNIEFFTGCKKFKQRRVSFVLGYLGTTLFVDEEKVHMAQIETWKNKNFDGFYTKTTQKGGFSKPCKNSILIACMPLRYCKLFLQIMTNS
jgi:hypothetical protein